MKKIILPLLTLNALFILANAQTYQPFPTGPATWEVARCWYFYQPGWYDKYTISIDGTDTLYDGESFKKIYITNHHLPGTVYDTIYPVEFFGGLRESNKQVFIYQIWASTNTDVQLVYDFNNTNTGDTIYTNVLSGNPNLFGHVVIETDSVLVGSQYHKRLLLQDINNSYNTEYWIEGIGSSWGLPFSSFWSITDNSYDLNCFYETQTLKYQNPSPNYGYCQAPHPTITCEIVSSTNAEKGPKSDSFSLHPNPASNQVALKIDDPDCRDISINIFDITGALVRTLKLNQNHLQFDVGDLNSGIYIVVIKSKNLIENKKLVVQR
jgi:hypothetical protein